MVFISILLRIQDYKQADKLILTPAFRFADENGFPNSNSISNTTSRKESIERSDDDTSIVLGEKSLAMTQNRYQQCMLELERMMHPLIWEWREARIPIPIGVKIMDGRFYAILLVYHAKHLEGDLRKANQIFCNDHGGAMVLGHRTVKIYDAIVIECPSALDPEHETFSKLSITTNPSPKANQTYNGTYTYTNDVLRKMDECERLDIASFELRRKQDIASPKTNPQSRPVKIGASITIRNRIIPWENNTAPGKNLRDQALEWAEYHHLIGVDHMWIYINEAWDDGAGLPQRDYITWIPFDWNIYNYKTFTKFPGDAPYFEVFRCASQTDAVWRARRESMDWLALIDVDEYVRVGPDDSCPKGKCNLVGSLSHFLRNFTDLNHSKTSVYRDHRGDIMGGIRLENIYYGRNTEIDQDEDIDLMIDNVWTFRHDPKAIDPNFRRKAIVVPNMIVSYHIHDITTSTEPFTCCKNAPGLIAVDAERIRVNHYKNSEGGVRTRKNRKGSFYPGE